MLATLLACHRECIATISNGAWTYRGRQHFSMRGSVCERELAYRGRPLAGGTYLVTPIGSYRIMIASEHGDADAGWERVSDRSSVAIPPGPAVATRQQLDDGFVAAERDSPRPRGVPATWAYLSEAIDPGWLR